MRRWLCGLGAALLLTGVAAAQVRSFAHVFHRTQAGIAPGADAHVLGYTTVTVHVAAAGTPSFNVHFLGSLDGTNWTLHHCQSTAYSDHQAIMMHTALGTGIWRCNVAGFTHFRAHVTAYTGAGASLTIVGTVMALPGLL